MLKDIIMAALVIQGVASTVIAYKSYKTVKKLETKINKSTGIVEELKTKVENAGNEIKGEINKQFYNLAFMRLF